MDKEKHKHNMLKVLKNKYLYVALGILVLIILLLIYLPRAGVDKELLTMEIADDMITSGETTLVKVKIENKNEYLEGILTVTSDDERVNITYPDPGLLNIQLYEGEMIQRVFEVTAVSTAFRTDYEITATLTTEDFNVTESVILGVQRS